MVAAFFFFFGARVFFLLGEVRVEYVIDSKHLHYDLFDEFHVQIEMCLLSRK